MTSSTELLRRLLDERGVEYETDDVLGASMTSWLGYEAYQLTPNAKLIMHPTPKQAVAATLGRGTCRNISNPPSGFLCSECRWGDWAEPSHLLTTAKFTDNDGGPNYCPNCGRKVVG